MRGGEGRTDFADQGEDDEGGDGVGDEGGDDCDEGCESAGQRVEVHGGDAGGDGGGDGGEEAGGGDGFAEGEAAGGQDDDGPEEVVEVFFGEDSRAEEGEEGEDGDDAHVAEVGLELVGEAPEEDGEDGDEGDEPLEGREAVSHWSDRDDGCAAVRVECDEEEDPDQEERDDAYWKGDEEPDAPARLRFHILEGNEVLRASDRGGSTADVGREGDAEEKGLGHGAV